MTVKTIKESLGKQADHLMGMSAWNEDLPIDGVAAFVKTYKAAYPSEPLVPQEAGEGYYLAGCSWLGYSTSMKLAFELPPAQADKLRDEAKRLGLTPEDLARAALADLLGTPEAEFRAAAARTLQKNEELYRRLA